MADFEDRYGGLSYDGMEYGLAGHVEVRDTPLGPAFGGIVDGRWTWGLDVLLDGRTAMGPGRLPYRIIDRSLTQRLERHALLCEVRGWYHQVFECFTPAHVGVIADERGWPPPVPEATGPAELWWRGPEVAVQATLAGWPPGRDRWVVRYFARRPRQVHEAGRAIYPALWHETVPVTWCTLCSQPASAGAPCVASG